MRTRPKDLGTQHETNTVRAAQDKGLVAERIAEGGQNDLGDVRLYAEHEWTLECKNTMQLNVNRTLQHAIHKSGTPRTAVVWRKMIRPPGHQRRRQDGPITVTLTLDAFLDLLGGH